MSTDASAINPRDIATELIRSAARDIDTMGIGEYLEGRNIDDPEITEQVDKLIRTATIIASWPGGEPNRQHVEHDVTTPAGTVLTAAARLDGRLDPIPGIPGHIGAPLASWLQNAADAMADDQAVEREHPDHIPAYRWQVHPGWNDDERSDRDEWTDALRLARALLHLPDPNAA
jgi:hypothetical protein